MSKWIVFKEGYSSNQKGQSLVELASFGTILLLCVTVLLQYGMLANYQQNLQMQTFRKAMKAAYYKSGPAASVSFQTTKDKSIPDARDPWGFAERKPLSASASLSWDNHMQASHIADFDDTPLDSDLPHQILEINDTLALTDNDLKDGAIDNIGQGQGAFKTAVYRDCGCNGSIKVVLESSDDRRSSSREEYREVSIACNNIKVLNRATEEDGVGSTSAYVKIDGLKHKIVSADIDGDNKLETIIAVRGTQDCDDGGYCGGVGRFKYMDYEEGAISSEHLVAQPWDVSVDEQQGLLTNYTLTRRDNNRIVKTKGGNETSTTTYVSADQRVTHVIRLNDGSTQEYTTNFRPQENSFTWRTSK